MLSIQAHPTREAAIQGFLNENKKNIAINAPNRVFKDKNPKPEMMVALTPFWLLHGFLKVEKAIENLKKIPSLTSFANLFENEGIKMGYQRWMELPQNEVDALLQPLKLALEQRILTDIDKHTPDYWTKKALDEFPSKDGHIDRGIFSIYVMNIVHLQPGEAIFQDAGLLHAYLEGINIELMVNSDNVFRGGLTDKYMDIPLLLDHLDFHPTTPSIILPMQDNPQEKKYVIPSKDFELRVYELQKNEDFRMLPTDGPGILLCLKGSISSIGIHPSFLNHGEAYFIPHQTQLHIRQEGEQSAVLFKAGIPERR
jgi:mannose-6-phosphate isomerase